MADWYRVTPVTASERSGLPSWVTQAVDLGTVLAVRVPGHVMETDAVERLFDALSGDHREVIVLSDEVEFVRLERMEESA